MYLTQMGEIPLLTRQQEISLAKQIEITRRRVPPPSCWSATTSFSMPYKVLKRVHAGELPFDRTVQVSVTDRLEKDQILGRLAAQPARRSRCCSSAIADDYRIATSKSDKPSRAPRGLDAPGPPPPPRGAAGRRAGPAHAADRAA